MPDARLLLKTKALADDTARAALIDRLARAGIAPERVELIPSTATVAEHLALYGWIHVALDSFPYHGTTTTCEALWMGVPVVTRTGDRHAARVGASLLAAVGLEELVAGDDDAFTAIYARLAHDPAALEALRHGLRDRLRASPLTDADGYRTRFARSIRAI